MMKLTESSVAPGAIARRQARYPLRGRWPVGVSALTALLLTSTAVIHAEDASILVKIKNHQFIPAEIEIPAGEKRQLIIENDDPTVEEFESHSLHREKVIPANSKVTVFVGPLKPGRYEFQGEFNEATAKGAVVAK